MPITHSPLRYPGGKSQLAPLLIELLRENRLFDGVYVEPFAGGCGIAWHLLLNNYMSEVWLNDFDPAIYSFWRSVIDDTEALCERIAKTPLTIAEWHRQKQAYTARKTTLDLGFATLYLNRTNRSGILTAGVIGGLNQDGNYKLGCRFNRENLIAKVRRIAMYRDQIKLFREDAAKFLSKRAAKLPARSLINIDPPYYRNGRYLYCNFYEHEDHANLAEVVRSLSRPWILTYDDTPEIRRIYGRRRTVEFDLRYSAQLKRVGTELLFASANFKLSPVEAKVA